MREVAKRYFVDTRWYLEAAMASRRIAYRTEYAA